MIESVYLIALTPTITFDDVNFINVRSMSSFSACRSQKHKKDCQLDRLFFVLGSACLKAARRTLMKLALDDVNL